MVILQECPPTLTCIAVPTQTRKISGDGPLRNMDSQFQQFAMDARCTPSGVFVRHRPDYGPNIADVVGLPAVLLRERKRQYRRKPCRCHPTTVSGLTIRSDLAQRGQKWRSTIQNNRSERCNRGRLVRRFKTINWCRKATISSPSSWRDRTKPRSQVNIAVISQSINSPLYQDERSHC